MKKLLSIAIIWILISISSPTFAQHDYDIPNWNKLSQEEKQVFLDYLKDDKVEEVSWTEKEIQEKLDNTKKYTEQVTQELNKKYKVKEVRLDKKVNWIAEPFMREEITSITSKEGTKVPTSKEVNEQLETLSQRALVESNTKLLKKLSKENRELLYLYFPKDILSYKKSVDKEIILIEEYLLFGGKEYMDLRKKYPPLNKLSNSIISSLEKGLQEVTTSNELQEYVKRITRLLEGLETKKYTQKDLGKTYIEGLVKEIKVVKWNVESLVVLDILKKEYSYDKTKKEMKLKFLTLINVIEKYKLTRINYAVELFTEKK